ncbi:DUF1707 domain-containing protein [Kitasatospora sp. NPDC101157]|uniref:DUF1707 SHOCT-like domain-containing protein n=1 Tax=Kitasatospora sp. NPDC101157 TaxID=3364098 RepID=UPI0038168A08
MPGKIATAGSRSALSAQPALRASHADRDQVVAALSVAAGDGRLTAQELDERVEAALSARTLDELTDLTADLPPLPAPAGGIGGTAVEPKDVLRIEQRFSKTERTGPWVLPRRLEIAAEWCSVTLDFTQAVITRDTLEIDVDMQGGDLTLIVGPGITVDPDGLTLGFSQVKNRHTPDPQAPIRLRIALVGRKSFGRLLVRRPRRWLPGRRTTTPPAGH